MSGILTTLRYYLDFAFVRYAIIVGMSVALCAALLGVVLVQKRLSHIGDGLSHVAFGAIAIATALKLVNQMWLVLPVTLVFSVLLMSTGKGARMRGDAAIAMLSVGSLSIGYLVMNAFPTKANVSGDVCTTLFGSTSILTLSQSEVLLSLGLSLVVVLVFAFLYHRIFSVTFDEEFATTTGLKAKRYQLLLAVLTACVVVLAMNLVGSLLIAALVIFPALSAMRVCRSFKAVTLCAASLGLLCALVGILISILAGTPVGVTIVITMLVVWLGFTLAGLMKERYAPA